MDRLMLNFADAQQAGNDIIEPLNRLRDTAPIYWSELNGAWVVTGHAEVAAAFAGKLPLSSARHKLLGRMIADPEERARTIPYMLQVVPRWVTNIDPPEQSRIRKLMVRAFSAKMAESYRPFTRQLIGSLLDDVAARGEVEFMEDVARRIPASLILRMLGLGHEHLPSLKRWAYFLNAGIGGAAPTIEVLKETEKCLIEMRDLFLDEIRKRQLAPTDDFISELVAARDGDDRLTEDELIATLQLTLIAGHDTTANSLALGIALLAADQEASAHMRAHPEGAANQVMEIMRLSGVSTSMTRLASQDFEWGGQAIKAGQVVILMIVAANRDPLVFADPARLDFSRPQQANMTFAPGGAFLRRPYHRPDAVAGVLSRAAEAVRVVRGH